MPDSRYRLLELPPEKIIPDPPHHSEHSPDKTTRCQLHSPLLALPPELRDLIYSKVLRDTHIPFGHSDIAIDDKCRLNCLALLYTCREMYTDVCSRWLGWVLFDFHSLKTLLSVLIKRSDTTVKAIRHIRVSGRPLLLSFPESWGFYGLVWIIKMLPQLQLHTLTILGGFTNGNLEGPAQTDYDMISSLVKYGTGWKELHYISPDSSVLSFAEGCKIYRCGPQPQPQPQAWRSKLTHRDGPNSGAVVDIYRAKTSIAGAVVNGHELEPYEQPATQDLDKPEEKDKEVLVVIKRGKNAKIVQKIDPEHLHKAGYDLRLLSTTWAEIRDRVLEEKDGDDALSLAHNSSPFSLSPRTWAFIREEFMKGWKAR